MAKKEECTQVSDWFDFENADPGLRREHVGIRSDESQLEWECCRFLAITLKYKNIKLQDPEKRIMALRYIH